MYGTVARLQVQPEKAQAWAEWGKSSMARKPKGLVSQTVYRLDKDPNAFILAVVFESKEAYRANAESPEQDAEFREFRAFVTADPEWSDGEVVNHEG